MIERVEKEVDLIDRHVAVLEHVIENQPTGIVTLSDELGHPNHKIRYSLRVLEEEQVIEPTTQGAITTDRAPDFLDEHRERFDEIIDQLEALSDPKKEA